MFKRDVNNIKDLILKNLRAQGLETPLLQKRLIDSWAEVAGPMERPCGQSSDSRDTI